MGENITYKKDRWDYPPVAFFKEVDETELERGDNPHEDCETSPIHRVNIDGSGLTKSCTLIGRQSVGQSSLKLTFAPYLKIQATLIR